MKLRYTTARKLVEEYMPGQRITTVALHCAVTHSEESGWLVNGWPRAGNYDRTMVLIHGDSAVAKIVRYMRRTPCDVPRGLIEAALQRPLEDSNVARILGRHGLAMVSLRSATIHLVPTSPALAQTVNATRYVYQPRSRLTSSLICAALDLPGLPKRITVESRLHAAEVYERYNVNAASLLDMEPLAKLTSPWTFAREEWPAPPF